VHSRMVMVFHEETKWNGLKSNGICFQTLFLEIRQAQTLSDRVTFTHLVVNRSVQSTDPFTVKNGRPT
jgi:hypothetical protein